MLTPWQPVQATTHKPTGAFALVFAPAAAFGTPPILKLPLLMKKSAENPRRTIES